MPTSYYSGEGSYGRMWPGIRGVRLEMQRVEAEFKYDDHNPVEHRERVGWADWHHTGPKPVLLDQVSRRSAWALRVRPGVLRSDPWSRRTP